MVAFTDFFAEAACWAGVRFFLGVVPPGQVPPTGHPDFTQPVKLHPSGTENPVSDSLA